MITDPSQTFTVSEAARRLGIGRATLNRDIVAGKIRVYRFNVGRRKVALITAEDLADYALQHRRGRGIPGA